MSAPQRFHLLTLFPEYFRSALEQSIVARAQRAGLVEILLHDIREAATDRHRTADDSPYGGGAGMVMKAEPIVRSLEAIEQQYPRPHRILLAAHGKTLRQQRVRELACMPELLLLCGHYEGIDERVQEGGFIDESLSIGDYVLTGGEPAALVILDAIVRLRPGVLGNESSTIDESFGAGELLEYPQYTRPADFRGLAVPEILRSGDHGRVEQWRKQQGMLRTLRVRPDLLLASLATLSPSERIFLAQNEPTLWARLLDLQAASPSSARHDSLFEGEKFVDMPNEAQQNVASVGLDEEESHRE